jgi:hypothetical protein
MYYLSVRGIRGLHTYKGQLGWLLQISALCLGLAMHPRYARMPANPLQSADICRYATLVYPL